jgi:hypothetical protein
MGLKSGLYDGKNTKRQPQASMRWRTAAALCTPKLVHHDHAARLQGRAEHLVEVSQEHLGVGRPFDAHGRQHPLGGEGRQDRGVRPAVAGRLGPGALAPGRPAVQGGEGQITAALIDKDQRLRLELRLGLGAPGRALLLVAFAGAQADFFCDSS